MTQTRKAARNGRNSHQRTVVRRLRTLNLLSICGLDKEAVDLLKVVTNPGSCLYNQVCHKLIGFDARVQRYLVECVALYYAGEAVTFTAFPHVNRVLKRLYKSIDKVLDAGR